MTATAGRRGRLFLALALLWAACAPAFGATGLDIGRLMALFAGKTAGEARFVERKYLAVLDQPVESSGILRYRAPDHLERETVEPRRESLIVDGDTLTLERGDQRHVVRLSDYPQVAPFVDSIRATLAGDRKALEQAYALYLSGTLQGWKLALLPKDPQMAAAVLRITLSGREGELREVEILQADGDRSVMTIRPVAAK